MIGVMKSLTRLFGLTVKELRDLLRRPGAILSLVFGPLAIMALFGVGFQGERRPFDTVIVLPQGSTLPHDVGFYRQIPTSGINVVGVSEDEQDARARLLRREIRLFVVVPPDAEQQFRAGQHATLRVVWNEVDPIEDNIAKVSSEVLVRELNSRLVEEAAAEGMTIAGVPKAIPPDVIARPLEVKTENTAPIAPSMLFFFAPAVFALILQHLGITLTALSLVRERLSGAMDLFRVAPVRSWEILLGKYVAYGILSLFVAAAVMLLLVSALHVPLLGSPERIATGVFLVTFASLGVGLLISLLADSERQAVQLAMLVLLVSMFFSGFVLPINEFREPVRYLSYVLPVTYGIQVFQDVMLRGGRGDSLYLVALVALGFALYLVDAVGLRAVMRRVR
ncbi:MAG TPA: ABC transporter permease [Candidatus Limnocylindria bacterium]